MQDSTKKKEQNLPFALELEQQRRTKTLVTKGIVSVAFFVINFSFLTQQRGCQTIFVYVRRSNNNNNNTKANTFYDVFTQETKKIKIFNCTSRFQNF